MARKTRDEILEMIINGHRIALIREYRAMTGRGLREAIDAIDKNSTPHIMGDGQHSQGCDYDREGLLELFGYPEDKAKEDIARKHQIHLDRFRIALDFAVANYDILGYSNPNELVSIVNANFEGQD